MATKRMRMGTTGTMKYGTKTLFMRTPPKTARQQKRRASKTTTSFCNHTT